MEQIQENSAKLPLKYFIISLLIGLSSGTFGGLVGLGGGVIMIPLMVSVLKFDQHSAHGTSLFVLIFTGIAGAISYGLHGNIDVIASVLLAFSAVFTARSGAHFAHSLPAWKLKRFFGYFIIFISIFMFTKHYFPNIHLTGGYVAKIILFLVTGTVTGFISGMMGVGGGSLMVPVMVLLAGISQHTAQGTSLLAMVPTSSAGAHKHWQLGNVKKVVLPGLVLGIFIGAYVGATLANLFSDFALRVIFGSVLVWTGVRYILTKKPAE